jgi:small basic protein (TIGR04137 family)
MSQHPSLRSSDKDKQHRSVLKRHERVKVLKEKEKWVEGASVFGLPKVKILRFKIKKEKAAPAEAVAGAEGAAAPATAAAGTEKAAAPAKAAATAAKGAPAKEAAKPQAAEPKKEAKK